VGINYVIKRVDGETSFLRRHSRWLAFISTVVVLGTFIVNEGLVDEAKDLSSSLDSARNAFAQHLREERILAILARVEDSVDSQKTHIYGNSTDSKWLHPDFDTLNAEYSPLLELYDKLPYDKNLDDLHWEIEKLIKTAKGFEDRELDVAAADRRTIESQQLENAEEEAVDSQLAHIAKMLGGGTENVLTEVLAKANQVITERAQSAQESAERNKKIGKYFGFVLYPLGVLLGLVGKLSGDPESEIEEGP